MCFSYEVTRDYMQMQCTYLPTYFYILVTCHIASSNHHDKLVLSTPVLVWTYIYT
jgi:hypothetical protein